MRTPPVTSSGPSADAQTSIVPSCLGRAAPTRRVRRAPEGQRATASSTASALAASMRTHGRRLSSKTCGSARTQLREWKQRRGSHSTTISSVAYSFANLSRPELTPVTLATEGASRVGSVLEPVNDGFGPRVRPHLRHGPFHVVSGPLEPDPAVLEERPRGARIPVEGHADAAGVDQERAARPGPPELLVAVAEQDRPVGLALEHSFLVRLRLRRKRVDVGPGRAVAD